MKLHELIQATFSVMGQELSDEAVALMTIELQDYPEDAVRMALRRCRTELRKLTLADILDRLPGGHPGVEEAWAIVGPSLGNEGLTVVWTNEMREAFGSAVSLAEDKVAARMAFKEKYLALLAEARQARRGPEWSVSLGWDVVGRETAIQHAVQHHRLSAAVAQRYLPGPNPKEAATLVKRLT